MDCPSNSQHRSCSPANCRLGCGRDTISTLLAEASISDIPGAYDTLLDFRSAVDAGDPDARHLLETFFALRTALENRFYLSTFRLRNWIESQVIIETRVEGEAPLPASMPDTRFRSLQHLERRARQERFENDLEIESPAQVEVLFSRNPAVAAVPC